MKAKEVTELNGVSNDASSIVSLEEPYIAEAELEGTVLLIFHRWSVDGVEAKAKAAKGSKAKKEDDLESYVYRNHEEELAIPGEYFRMSIVNAAKFRQDPRSPRKSAMDLFKAGIMVTDELCSLGTKKWDFIDRRRVTVQRSGITRHRPAMHRGWKVRIGLQVVLPEYIQPIFLNEVLQLAGRVVGVADFRPTYGRFLVNEFMLR